MEQQIIYTNFVEETVDRIIEKINPSSLFILVDDNTNERVLPRLQSICKSLKDAQIIKIKPGDENKNLDSLSYIWEQLSLGGATRNSLLINIGGGMLTDIGGFAAATFKRGIRFINIPTTLLGAVDAAIGGKTGINYNGLKNEIGAFKKADSVIISTVFLGTLPPQEIKSGYAEMIKHALLTGDKMINSLLKRDILDIDPNSLLELIEKSNEVKNDIVEQDPHEENIRKALNFGHTIGHAFESLSLERDSPLPHGYAVAYGMVVEIILSSIKYHFPKKEMDLIEKYIEHNYGKFAFDETDIDKIIAFMKHDKKNIHKNEILMTLLQEPGKIEINVPVIESEIRAALEIYKHTK